MTTRNPPKSSRSAFTLIELLIVIVIILILSAMLLPVIAMVRSQAYSAQCCSNLRQIAMAHIAYANDYNGRIPGSDNGTNADPFEFANYLPVSDRIWWGGLAISDTARSSGGHVWCCPLPALNCQDGSGIVHPENPWTCEYYMNWAALGPSPHSPNGYLLQNVKRVVAAVICADLDTGGYGGWHRGHSNLAFLDGHVGSHDEAPRSPLSGNQADPGQWIFAEYFSYWPSAQPNGNPMKGWDY